MKKKFLGIGVAGIAFLLLSVAMLVPVTATPAAVKTMTVIPEAEADSDFDAIDEILLRYKDDLAEIDSYIESYIAEYGAIDGNFVLPEYLQVKFDNIVNEFATTLGGVQPLGGYTGYTLNLQWWGFQLWLYLDHYWTTILGFLGPVGVSGIAAIISWLSYGALAPFAILAAVLICSFGVELICSYDRGNGVVIYVQWSMLWFIPSYASAWSQ